jgi:hypothetical protein
MATFCHSPPDSSTPFLKRFPIICSYPPCSRAITSSAWLRSAARLIRLLILPRRDFTNRDVVAGAEILAHEILKYHAHVSTNGFEVIFAQSVTIEEDPAFVRIVEAGHRMRMLFAARLSLLLAVRPEGADH